MNTFQKMILLRIHGRSAGNEAFPEQDAGDSWPLAMKFPWRQQLLRASVNCSDAAEKSAVVFGTIVCVRKRYYFGALIGASGPVISVAIFLVIFLFNLSPTAAQRPVPLIGAVYMAILCAMGLVALRETISLQANAHIQAGERISEMPH
jgi:hypothetical protein